MIPMKNNFSQFKLVTLISYWILAIFSVGLQSQDFPQIANEIMILDSDTKWEFTTEEIDPKNFVNNNLENINWQTYKVPSNLNSEIVQTKNKIWIRRKFVFPENLSNQQLAIRLGIISDRDKTYFNEVLIGSTGIFGSPIPQSYDKLRVYEIPQYLVQKENTILIEVERFFPEEIGINQDTTAIGPTLQMQRDKYKEDLFKLVLLSIYATVGFYFLFLFLRRRQEQENLLFALFAFCVVMYQFMRTQIKYELGVDFILMKKVEYFVFTALIPLFTNFIRTYFKFKISKFLTGLNFLSLLVMLFFLVNSDLILFDKINKFFVQPIGFIFIGNLFYFLICSMKKKNKDAFYIFVGVCIIFISVVIDILSDRGYFQITRTFGYTFIFFILSIAIILANKFVRLHNEVEELNTSLENKVEQRTKELNDSMKEIQQIKTQQDGDYFLTSLLLSPLTANKNTSEFVHTEFYSKQKKTFHFKNKIYEIGGDISITANILLNNKQYTVFINGDAMGKSIQGAGGALVMGVVFNTVLSRSQVASFKTKTPEKWIKDAFLELQRIFESFDGTMFLSCVMGLIDDETGFLYYINAEHPWTVLYRDGEAKFIEQKFTTRKLGIFENEKLFQVQTMNLKEGDVLILGSDGRDDIQIGSADNVRVINEDETLFLSLVKEANGNLKEIANLLHKTGELTDDCSLLRIEYKGSATNQNKIQFTEILYRMFPTHHDIRIENYIENIELLKTVHKLNPFNEIANLQLGFFYLKRKDYTNAIKHINHYTYKKPESTEMLYLASLSNKKCGNYDKAVDIGEQILLREPQNYKNLKNLKKLCKLANKSDRERELDLKIKELKK